MKIIHIDIPEYNNNPNIDLKKIASKIDNALTNNFLDKKILLRTVSSSSHDINTAELINLIVKTGTDRYDPTIKGDRYDNKEKKRIDLFGRICTVKPGTLMSRSLLEGFHIYGAEFHKKPSARMDIWIIYDRQKLKSVRFTPKGSNQIKGDGYVFKEHTNMPQTLLGLIVIKPLSGIK